MGGGLRDKKKRETLEKILSVSKEIILSKGYSKITMEEIAEKSEIGVGTLYNYFKSKAEIFVAVMSDEFVLDDAEIEYLENDLEIEVVDVILEFVWKLTRKYKIISKRLWKELFSATLSTMKASDILLKSIIKLDYNFIEKLKKLLQNLKDKGVLPKNFKEKEAAYAVYSVLMTQLILYIYSESTFEMFLANIENQIRFIFEGKCLIKEEE